MIVYHEAATLARDLGVGVRTLYAVSNSLPRHYRQALLPKGDGTARRLAVPDEPLKHIQRRITETLLLHMPVSPHATAYRCGGSVLRNAAPHTGKAKILKLDILHFFDSVLYSAVKDAAFPAHIYAEPLRILLTILCYYRDALPQGAPSSSAISNLVLRPFDDVVGPWCAKQNIAYTRYCDDLTFSGDFQERKVVSFVAEELRRLGFFLNPQKTVAAHVGQRQAVTGLVVNEKVNISAAYRRKLRQELYFCRKFGPAEHLTQIGSALTPEAYLRSLLGRTDFVLQVAPEQPKLWRQRTWLLDQMHQQNT